MKKHILLFYLIISYFATIGQPCKMYLTINPIQCVSCNNFLHNLKYLDSNIEVSLVFKEKYKTEKAYLEKQLILDGFDLPYIWSDSLYKKLIVNKSISSATFVSSDGNHHFKKALQSLNHESGFIDFCNRQAVPSDTIRFKNKFLTPGVRNFIYENNEYYVVDNIRDQVRIYSNVHYQDEVDIIPLTDDLIRKSFKMKFNSLEEYELSKKLINELEVTRPNSIIAIQPKNGLTYVMTAIGYFLFENQRQDTLLTSFYTLHVFNGPKLMKSYLLDGNYEEGGINGYYFLARYFHIKDEMLYMGLIKSKNAEKNTNYFLASFKLTGDSTYTFHEFLPYSLSETYTGYDDNFLDFYFWESYCALALVDKLYSLNNKQVLDLNIFPKEQMIDKNNQTYHKYVYDFKLDENYIYLNYYNFTERQYYYLKYDRQQEKVVSENKLFTDLELGSAAVIDPEDFNYVIIPITENLLVRKKMTKP